MIIREVETTMTKRISCLRLIPVAVGLIFMAVPIESQATPITITNVTVNVGSTAFSLWTFPVTLLDGQTLVLTQNNPAVPASDGGRFNFDTSDVGATPATVPTVNVSSSIGAFLASDTFKVLSVNGVEAAAPGGPTFNEAQPYRVLGSFGGGSLEISVAYADNAHSNACGSGAVSAGLIGEPNCLPSPFNGNGGTTAATFFQGLPGPAGPASSFPNHCPAGSTTCWDAGVVLIRNTSAVIPVIPEPSTLFLLGTGLFGVAGWKWRRRSKTSA